MTAKQYLRQVRTQNKHIDSLIAEKERLTELAEGLTGISYDDVKVQTSRTSPGNRQTDAVYRLVELEERITNEIDRFVDMREEVTKLIDSLTQSTEQDLLRYRYLCGLTWEQVAERMKYDNRTVYKIHGKALLHLEQLVDFKG